MKTKDIRNYSQKKFFLSLNSQVKGRQIWIEDLYLSNIKQSEQVGLLRKFLKKNPNIKKINLVSKKIIDEKFKMIIEAISYNDTYINSVNASGDKIPSNETKYFFESLKQNKLTYLNISGNNIEGERAKYFADFIKDNESIRTINASNNNIGDPEIKHISASLKENTSIRKIILSYNKIGNDGIESFFCDIKRNDFIRKINLLNNNIETGVLKKIIDHLQQNSSIIEIIFGWQNFKDCKLKKQINFIFKRNCKIEKYAEDIINLVNKYEEAKSDNKEFTFFKLPKPNKHIKKNADLLKNIKNIDPKLLDSRIKFLLDKKSVRKKLSNKEIQLNLEQELKNFNDTLSEMVSENHTKIVKLCNATPHPIFGTSSYISEILSYCTGEIFDYKILTEGTSLAGSVESLDE